MSLPHALLGLIQYRPATGYELKAAFDSSIHFFWNATLPQIYRTLSQMEADGWVTSKVEHQAKKPSRRVFSLTAAGRSEFQRWLAEPPEQIELRNPVLVKLFFGHQMSPDLFRAQIRKWQESHSALLARFESEIDPLIERYAKSTGATKDADYWRLCLDYGKRHAQMVIDWCERVVTARDPRKRQRAHGH